MEKDNNTELNDGETNDFNSAYSVVFLFLMPFILAIHNTTESVHRYHIILDIWHIHRILPKNDKSTH